jgi:carboxymethylenebutenolidase
MSTRWEEVAVGDDLMSCYFALPESLKPVPGVIVCMHAPGVDPFIRSIVERLAEVGFAALAPDLYHGDPAKEDDPLTRMGRLRDDQIIQDLQAAAHHLRSLREVQAEHTASIGFCMGGRIAYLHAAEDPRLKAAVVFYGGNIMVRWGHAKAPFERSAGIACPVLGLFGEEDTNPSPADVAKIDAELERLGKPHEFHSYPGAGHAFLNFARVEAYRPDAAADAWSKCVSWLQTNLSGG